MDPGAGTATEEAAGLARTLRERVARGDRDLAGQLRLLVRFDDLEGWRVEGTSSCVAWMDARLGLDAWEARERLRVGRALGTLTVLARLFDAGRLSWAKVRLISNVASLDDERALCRAALDGSVGDVRALCDEFRHRGSIAEGAEDRGADRAFEERSLRWHDVGEHLVRVVLELPRAEAAEWIKSLEASEDALHERARHVDPGEIAPALAALYGDGRPAARSAPRPEPPRPAQRRADAALAMAATSLAAAGEPVARSDRYRVLVNVDVAALDPPADPAAVPPTRAFASGFGPLAPATARRLACDAGLAALAVDRDADALDVGRRTRAWPASMRRAALARDRRCQVPGCGATRYLDVHHVVHWIDGGPTSLDNAACVCRRCHVMLHEGGYALERLEATAPVAGEPPDARVARALVARVRRFRLVRADR